MMKLNTSKNIFLNRYARCYTRLIPLLPTTKIICPSAPTVQLFFSVLESHVPAECKVEPCRRQLKNFSDNLRLKHKNLNDGDVLLFSIIKFFTLFLPSEGRFHSDFSKNKHSKNNSLILFPISRVSDFFCFRFLTYYYEAVRDHRPGFPVYARDHYNLYSEALKDITPRYNGIISRSPNSAEAEQARKRIRADETHIKRLLLAENEINKKISSLILPGVFFSPTSKLSYRYFSFDLAKFNFHSSSSLEFAKSDSVSSKGQYLKHEQVFARYDFANYGYRGKNGFNFYGFDGPEGLRIIEEVLETGMGGSLLFTCHIALKRAGEGSHIPFLNYEVFTK
jgi:hypothetical protein